MIDQTYLIYGVVAAVVILIVVLIIINNQRNKDKNLLPFDVDELIAVLGGKENVVEYQSSLSKITLKLKDNSLVNLVRIKELGASGIVETSDGFSFIFGSVSPMIAQELAKKMK